MIVSEKQFNSKATTESFDEIYTNFDVSVKEDYLASSGYPFDYPTKWLNDPSMNKRIAIRRLDVLPSTHTFTLKLKVDGYEDDRLEPVDLEITHESTFDITYQDSLIKVLNHICSVFTFYDDDQENKIIGQLKYQYDTTTNDLTFKFHYYDDNDNAYSCDFAFDGTDDDLKSFLRFLNQHDSSPNVLYLTTSTKGKVFSEVWSRDRLYFHASFSTSRRKFIGKRGDFYQSLTLLYPSPTNESTFYIRFTANGIKPILIRHCEFDIQLCFVVNYKKAVIL